MYCRKCGQKLKETSRFCKICGTPVMMESTIEDEVISPMKHKKRWPIIKTIGHLFLCFIGRDGQSF